MSIRTEKAILVGELKDWAAEVESALRACPSSDFEEVRSAEGWQGRDFVGHIASVENVVYRRTILRAMRILDPSVPEPEQIPGFPNDWNEQQRQARAAKTVDELIDEWVRNRAELIRFVESTPADVFEIWLPDTRPGNTAAGVLRMLAGQHVRQHARQAMGTL